MEFLPRSEDPVLQRVSNVFAASAIRRSGRIAAAASH